MDTEVFTSEMTDIWDVFKNIPHRKIKVCVGLGWMGLGIIDETRSAMNLMVMEAE